MRSGTTVAFVKWKGLDLSGSLHMDHWLNKLEMKQREHLPHRAYILIVYIDFVVHYKLCDLIFLFT